MSTARTLNLWDPMLLGALLSVTSVAQLAAGIVATQDPGVAVSPTRAEHYAEAAIKAADVYHVDAFELIGVAREESRYRADEIGPDGKDCGIMQTRITGSRYKCRQLRNDFQLGFMEGARELAHYRDSCRHNSDFDRCRFNRYNSGVHYLRRGFHGHYWLRVMCFAEAARAEAPGGGCLEVPSRRAIARAIRKPPRGHEHQAKLLAAAQAHARAMH
jgi:hypothetical protein